MALMRARRLYPPAQSLTSRRPIAIDGSRPPRKAAPAKRKPERAAPAELPLWRVHLPNGVRVGVMARTKSEARGRAKVVLKLERLPAGSRVWLAGEGDHAE